MSEEQWWDLIDQLRRGKRSTPAQALNLAHEGLAMRRAIDDALIHYAIGQEPDGAGLPVDWRYVAERMAGALEGDADAQVSERTQEMTEP